MNLSVQALWEQFKETTGITHDCYMAWAFGDSSEMADELLSLVLNGEKTGTSSLQLLYELEQEPLPQAGSYSVLLDGNEQAQAVICTKVVDILPYAQISEIHGYLEGEGERNLAYWRSVHQPFFERELQEYQLPFTEDLLIVYELFEVVYRK
ncbi:ASCH domain-containing protein [Erwinia sp. CPCC 100877]|nr:ASCH domain-containing protein [Erwinia sp. CPCC 100877]